MKKDNSRTTEGILYTLIRGLIVLLLIALAMHHCSRSRARAMQSLRHIATIEDRAQVHEMRAYHAAQGREIVTLD